MAYSQHNFAGLPQGSPYLHSPDLSQFNDYHSASAGSSESFQTQVPLPYYHNSGEEQQRFSTPQMPSPWATPDLGGSATMDSFQGPGKTLNPASSPYVPSGQLSQYPIGTQSTPSGLQPPSAYSREGSFSSSSSIVQPYQAGGQIGQIGQVASYQGTYPYTQQPNMLGGPVGGGFLQPHLPKIQQSTAPSFGQYAPLQPFQGYNSSQHMSNTHASALPPAYPPMNTPQTFSVMQNASGGTNTAVNQPWLGNISGPGPHNTSGTGQAGGAYAGYNQSTSFGAGLSMPYSRTHGSSHTSTQESSSASMTSKQSTATRGETPTYQGQDTIKKAERRVSIHTPLVTKATRQGQTSTPATIVKDSKSALKIEQPPRLEAGDAEPRRNVSLTLDSRSHALDPEASSEPRKIEGVTIRSKRGHTFSSGDPSQKKSVFDWIQTTPGLEAGPSRDSSGGKRQASPPKMMNLLAAGSGIASNLKTINENDPFVSRASDISAKNSTDPFASMKAIVPYTSNNQLGLLGQASAMSLPLRNLTCNGTRKPSFAEAVDPRTLPFAETCRLATDDKWGVVKIKNIPYSVNRPEVLAFLGRNAKVVAESDNEPVHIIMERVTSKTLDCYVEFVSFDEAVAAVNRFETNRNGGRSGRLGHRHVDVELSSQEHLMKDLFPKAKNVHWAGSKPTILPPNEVDIYSSGFQGFVSREEMVMLVKHVESPQRSPFSKDCPQRPFECLISTLIKYPWYMVDFITIEQRNMLHKATIDLLTLLVERVSSDKDDLCLTPMLLKRVWKAALKCPGFTPAMKDDIIYLCQLDALTAAEYGVPPYAPYWKYLWTIGPKPGAQSDLLLWYIAIIRETTQKRHLSLAEQAAMGHNSDDDKLFGNLDGHLNFPPHFHQMTLAEVARIEWTVLEMLLRQALS